MFASLKTLRIIFISLLRSKTSLCFSGSCANCEKNVRNCGKCSVCDSQREQIFGRNISQEIIEALKKKPSTVEEIAVKLNYYAKENILENLIYLLDSGKVQMLNFRTYAVKM